MMAKYCKKENVENSNSHDKPVVASGTVYRSDSKTLATLISLINVEVDINMEGVQNLLNH